MKHKGWTVWESFLGRILPDPDIRRLVQRAVGMGHYDEPSSCTLLILSGRGATGKTTFATTLREALGTMVVERIPELAPARFTVATVNLAHPRWMDWPVVPFQVEIPRGEMDRSLPGRLAQSDVQAAVLVWAFEGYLMAKTAI